MVLFCHKPLSSSILGYFMLKHNCKPVIPFDVIRSILCHLSVFILSGYESPSSIFHASDTCG